MALNLKKLMFAALPLLLPACAQDEPGEGRMPMEFTVSLADESPQSRVSESDDGSKSVWTNGDKITVNVTQGGSTQTATCTLDADGNVTKYSPTLYWESRESVTVSATYSNLGATNSIADQSRGLAYVLRADASTTYGDTIGLTFRHQFAKVRIKFEGSKASEVTDVKINNYTQCTVATDGKVTGSSDTEGYIVTRKIGDYFEANVCPVTSLPDNFIDAGEDFKVSVTGITSLEAGKVYTIDITENKVEVELETYINGHKAILMRKPTATEPALYFATTNIGADNPEEPGLYFMYGDIEGGNISTKSRFKNTQCPTWNKTSQQFKSEGILTTDNFDTAVLTPEYDAAQKIWQGGWRMPTKADFQWLIDHCTWNWIKDSDNNLEGYNVKSNESGKSIFIPAARAINSYGYTYYNETTSIADGYGCGYYQTSNPMGKSSAQQLYFDCDNISLPRNGYVNYVGIPIRPVISVAPNNR